MRQKLAHIFRLGLKELTSLRHDTVLLLFLVYAFSVAIYMPAAGSLLGVHNASAAFVDEDHSQISRRLAESLQMPEFQPPLMLSHDQIDAALDSGRQTFVINVPVNFQADLLAGRQPELQVNIDATAMSQAFMGAGYIRRIFQSELYAYTQQSPQQPATLASRALFNSNLESGWFLGVIQIVNNVTILAIILTGTALLREREHGTLDHLLVLPLTALEIMLAKVWSNALVVVCCTWLALELIVRGALGVPLTGSMPLFLGVTALYLFACTSLGIFLATLARSIPQFGLLAIPVIIPMLMLSGGTTPLDSMPVWLQNLMQFSPSTHFVTLSTSILFRDAGVSVIWPDIAALAGIGLAFFLIALARFRRTLAA
ncbi:ABC-2 type transport system permease protein [Pseudomonas fluvialis]|uniref:ABC-2 type transport system permease protein n=1 Tax=Pseudomonas fluvialis TaxID=1793966 RepID=A0A7X0BVW5_9PSED|nr:ABC transporter permease [Pseudomonas fluvialis]MBB6342795.1 ABC-2 type transport system permease protein [Pseudomonas fluvialis]